MNGIDLLKGWMEKTGVDAEALDTSGRVLAFVYNEDLPISIESPAYCDDVFIIIEMSQIGTGEMKRKRLEKCMQLNAYVLETRGAALGWDNIGERIILSHRTTSEHTDVDMLDNMVTNLIELSEIIKPQLAMKKEADAQEKMASSFDHMFQPIVP